MRPSYLTWAWIVAIACVGCGAPAPSSDDGGGDSAASDGGGRDGGPPIDAGPNDAAATDAYVGSSVLVHAASGGLVRADDGLYELYVMPGALAADTTITITRLAPADVPADVAATMPVSAVYSVEPDGLVFGGDGAYEHFVFPTIPAGLVTPASATSPATYGSLVASSRAAAGGTIDTQAYARSTYDAGGLDVTAAVAHLSLHWANHLGHEQAWLGVDIGATNRTVGESWAIPAIELDVRAPISELIVGNASEMPAVSAVTRPGGSTSAGHLGDYWFTGHPTFEVDPHTGETFTAGTIYPLHPHPIFRCDAVGDANVLVATEFRTPGYYLAIFVRDTITCSAGLVPAGQVFLGDTTQVMQTGGALVLATTHGAAANVLSEDDALLAHCSLLSGNSELCSGVTAYTSHEGAPTYTLDTALVSPSVLASYQPADQQYNITQLTPEAVAAGYTLTVRDPDVGGQAVITAPPPVPADALGAPHGLDTTLALPTGSFTDVGVTILLSGGPATGETSVTTWYAAADLTTAGGRLSMPIAPTALQTALTTAGLTPTSVRLVVANQIWDTELFPGFAAVRVQAGHVLDIDYAELLPPPAPGAEDTRACSATPHTFGQYDDGSGVLQTDFVVCIDASGCRMANALVCSMPNVAYNASTTSATSSGGFTLPPDFSMPWSSNGVARAATSAVVGASNSLIIERSSDHARWRIDYVPSRTSTLVTSIAPWSGVVPPFGNTDDCERLPQTYATAVPGGTIDDYARLCLQTQPAFLTPPATLCSVFGDVAATPENEVCPIPFALTLAADHATGAPQAYVASGWTITSTSAGTLVGSTSVTGLPVGSDVTIDVQQSSTARWHVVAQWTGASYVVQSVTPY